MIQAQSVSYEQDGIDGEDHAAKWQRVRKALQSDLGQAFAYYIQDLGLIGLDGARVTLAAPTAFVRRHVMNAYGDALRRAWTAELARVAEVEIVVDASACGKREDTPAAPAPIAAVPANVGDPGQWDAGFGLSLNERYTFENFVVGKPNEFAYNAARTFAEEERPNFNPLFLHGISGVGKTHLMHAIGWEMRKRWPARRVLFLSSERFMQSFIRAIRQKDTLPFKDILRSADVLMIDDIHFLGGKDSTQEEFFHTFNALIESGKLLVFTADRPPVDLDGVGERVKSRLQWGLVADIHPADFELRLGILQSKAEKLSLHYNGMEIPARVLTFLAQKIISNVRVLEGSLQRLVANAALTRRPVTLELAQEVLADILRASDRKILIEDIQKKVAEFYNIRQADLISPRRSRNVARPRQVAMFLAKKLTTRSLPEIGRKFGGRDHTTVIYAVRKIDDLAKIDASLNEELTVLQRLIEG
ncbi:MAG: chromosomal replication initiator protein DnaA [Alphaproteobacteria bacterium]|nr:chromosomal replication initiator protein DnaA [Alphaproteobacteria bacterium]